MIHFDNHLLYFLSPVWLCHPTWENLQERHPNSAQAFDEDEDFRKSAQTNVVELQGGSGVVGITSDSSWCPARQVGKLMVGEWLSHG